MMVTKNSDLGSRIARTMFALVLVLMVCSCGVRGPLERPGSSVQELPMPKE